ncbi:MAG: cysteine desulfurase-like protein [Chthoniobacterales bacterium]|nr:cysteine desulfurase-like protein [Chthoniobacterales bacterium]
MNPRNTKTAQPGSIDAIHSHFPALARVHKGRRVAYFDGPGGTQVASAVVKAMSDYLYNHNANMHWEYPSSNETDVMIANARAALADFLNASPEEIIFGQNMTSVTFHLSRALGRALKADDEVIVTELDHHSNVDSWRALEEERGVRIRVLPMKTESGQLELEKLPHLFNKRTKLIALGAASNALGTINDIEHVVKVAREAGVMSFIDAVHFAPHNLLDVKKIGCDFLACSAYKFYGPHIGVLYARKELLETIDFPKVKAAANYGPERAETGTRSHEAIVGAGAAVNFMASLAEGGSRRERLSAFFTELHLRDRKLTRALWRGLSEGDGIEVYGPAPDRERTALVAFTVRGCPSREIAEELAKEAIFISHGNFLAATVVERLGVAEQGLARAGCACYTTLEEVERLVAGVRAIAKRKRGIVRKA